MDFLSRRFSLPSLSRNEIYLHVISFPRSGQHLAGRMFERYFQEIGLPESEWHYCEFYNCCKRIPCVNTRNKRVIIQKSHDFGLDVPISKAKTYLVLYRADPVYQLEAYFRYHWCSELKMADRPDYSDKGTMHHIEKFFSERKSYYEKFLGKWVYPSPEPNMLRLTYDELVQHPVPSFGLIARRAGLGKLNTRKTRLDDIFKGFEKVEYRNRLDPERYEILKRILDSS